MSACVSASASALVDTLDEKATESIEDTSASMCVSASADAHVDTLLKVVQNPGCGTNILRVMKMGNIVLRVRIKPTSLAFRASVLTIIPLRLPAVMTLLMPTCT